MEDPAHRIAALAVGESETALFSLSGKERLHAIFARLGIPVAAYLDETQSYEDVLIAHAGFVFDERVIADFAGKRRSALAAGGGSGRESLASVVVPARDARRWVERLAAGAANPAAAEADGMTVYTAAEISGAYNQRLRKRETPLVARATVDRKDEIERRLFKGSYKGATDFVTKFVLPAPAFHATRAAAALRLHPNLITTVSLLLVLSTFYLFYRGEFAWGLVSGWLMCFLDTVDGKLARVTLKSSKWGNLYDHGIDLIHPPFWYWAWAAGAISSGELSGYSESAIWTMFWTVLAGYVAGRLIEGYFVRRFKIEIHIWRPIDYWFRHITSRRNPNLLLLTLSALFGAPALGLLAIAVWTAASAVFHAVRLAMAEWSASRGALKSWLAE